jgi:hypothetical protein
MRCIVGLIAFAVLMLYVVVLLLDMAYPRDPLREFKDRIKVAKRRIDR